MTKPLNILILEDRSADAELMMRELQREGLPFTAKRVWTEMDFRDELKSQTPDLILADYSLPSYDGLSALKLATKVCPGVPFILVSGGLGEEIAIESLHHGATDYVLKQRLARLGPSVRRALREVAQMTEQKQADDERKKLMLAVEQSPVTIVITDAEGVIEYVNPKFAELTGYTQAEAIGKTPRILKSGKMPPAFYENLWQTIKAGKIWRGIIQNRKKSGELFSEMATISPVLDKDGRIGRFIAIKEDITERLNLEDQLRQSQKMDAIGHLAAGVAHDFNNLLTIIQLETSILTQNPSLDAESRDGVIMIEKAAERAANLTRQLLAFSRKQEKEPLLIEMPELMADMTRLLSRILGEDIALTTQVSPGLSPLFADPGMIEQVIINLAVNSRDAMPGGGKLEINLSEVTFNPADIPQHPGGRPGSFLLLEVRDAGTGISPENLSRIFEPFFTTKEMGKGTGLGLSTVFGIVKLHDGWIEVSSELGRGTVFQVFLPVTPAGGSKQPVATHPAKLKGGTETILVAEDEESIRRLMQIALERYGYRVLVAETGTKAVEMLVVGKTKVDLLITDMVMPGGINGRELAQKIQAVYSDLKVIFVSGFTSDSLSGDLKLEPGVNFLRKPFSIYSLIDVVRHRLDEVSAK